MSDVEEHDDTEASQSSHEGITHISTGGKSGKQEKQPTTSKYEEFSRLRSSSEADPEDKEFSGDRGNELSPFLSWLWSKGIEPKDLVWLFLMIDNFIHNSITIIGVVGLFAGASLALAFPPIPLFAGFGLVISGMVGLLIGLEVGIVLNFLLRNQNSIDASTRHSLMWFAILLAPVSMMALAFTLALGAAPGLLFITGPAAGWLTLGAISAAMGLITLVGIFALAGPSVWQEFKEGLSDFFKGPGLVKQESLDEALEKSRESSSESHVDLSIVEPKKMEFEYEEETSQLPHTTNDPDNDENHDPDSTNSIPSSRISD